MFETIVILVAWSMPAADPPKAVPRVPVVVMRGDKDEPADRFELYWGGRVPSGPPPWGASSPIDWVREKGALLHRDEPGTIEWRDSFAAVTDRNAGDSAA